MLLCTMRTAVKYAVGFHAVSDHPAAAMGAGRRQRVDGTLKTVEHMRRAGHTDLKAFIVYVAAYFTSQPLASLHSSSFIHRAPLSLTLFLAVLTSRPGLRCRRLGALRHVAPRLRFETVATDLHRP